MQLIPLFLAIICSFSALAGIRAEEVSLNGLAAACLERAPGMVIGCDTAARTLIRVDIERLTQAVRALDGPSDGPRAVYDADILARGFVTVAHGAEPDFSSLLNEFSAVVGSREDICTGLALRTPRANPFSPLLLDLPPHLARDAGQLYAVFFTDGMLVPFPVMRGDGSSAVVPAPFELSNPGGAVEIDFVVTGESGLHNPDLACGPLTVSVLPLDFPQGAGRIALEEGQRVPGHIAALGELLGRDPGLDDDLVQAFEQAAIQALDAYDNLPLELQRATDLAAHAMRLDAMPAEVERLKAVLEQDRRSASLAISSAGFSMSPLPAIRLAQFDGDTVAGTLGSCPSNPDELAVMMDLSAHGRAHGAEIEGAIDPSTYFLGAQIAAGISAAMFAEVAVAEMGIAQATGGRMVTAVGASTGMGFALWGVYMDYVAGMLPSRYDGLEASLTRSEMLEDDTNPIIAVERVVLRTRSKGWDAGKAALDIVLGASGFLGIEGAIAGAGRSRLASGIAQFGEGLAQSSNKLASLIGSGGRTLAQRVGPEAAAIGNNVIEGTAGGMIAYMAGLQATDAYKSTLVGDTFHVPPVTCRIDMTSAPYSDVEIINRDTGTFAVTGRLEITGQMWGDATLRVRVNPEPNAAETFYVTEDYPVSVLLANIGRIDGPIYIQAGDRVDLEAVLRNVSRTHDVAWSIIGGRGHSIVGNSGTGAMLETSRLLANYPLTVTADLSDSYLMPRRYDNIRSRTINIYAGGLILIPDTPCIEPNGDLRIRLRDEMTGHELDPRDFVFSSVGGGHFKPFGILSGVTGGEEILVRARGVGANAYRGETAIRVGCACGSEFFDPAIIESSVRMASGYELLTLHGTLTREIIGSYNDRWETRNMSLMAIGAGGKMPFDSNIGAACVYAPAGPSAFPWASVVAFSHQGPLFMLEDSAEGTTQFAVVGQGVRSFAGEDVNGDTIVSRTGENGGLDDIRFYTTGAPQMVVERLDSGGLVLTYRAEMQSWEASRVRGFAVTGQPHYEPIERSLTYLVRFETGVGSTPERPVPPPAGGAGRGARGEPLL